MKLKGINSSSKKTINLIKKTFAELISEKKEISSITVTELVKRAGITRGAFYSHYDNFYQVATELETEILEKVFKDEVNIKTKEDMFIYFDKIFKYLEDNKVIYSKLLASNDALLFMNRLNKKIQNSLSNILGKKHYLNILFFTDGTISLIIKYFRNELDEDLKSICKYIKNIAEYLFFK